MVKFSKGTVFNYVHGNDLVGYDIDELENDYDFMIEVLKYSKDKYTIHCVSDELRHNINFVNDVLDIFINDKKFCISFLKEYLEKYSNDINDEVEARILLSNLTNVGDDNDLVMNEVLLGLIIKELEVQIAENAINNPGDQEQLKFNIILINFKDRKVVKDYFAKYLLDKIFVQGTNGNIEEYIKSYYNTPNHIKKIGVETFVLNIVRAHDNDLADYLDRYKDLMSDVVKVVNYIVDNWEEECDEDIYDSIVELIYEYLLEYNDYNLSAEDYITLVSKYYNININPSSFGIGSNDDDFEWYDDEEDEEMFSDYVKELDENDKYLENDEIKLEKILLQFKKDVALEIANYKKSVDPYLENNNKIVSFKNKALIKKIDNDGFNKKD